MAQTSNGSITITDLTDITDVYLEYCMAADSITTAEDIIAKTIWTPPERGWSTEYPTWQSGYQIWIREVTKKEGITQLEHGTPYLDKAVNQINNNISNIQTKIKKIWSNSTGSYMASGINGNDVIEDNVNTYGFNSKSTTTGISFNYNAIPLTVLGNDGMRVYDSVGAQVASLTRDGSQIGKSDGSQAYLSFDYHSFKMYDKAIAEILNCEAFDGHLTYEVGDVIYLDHHLPGERMYYVCKTPVTTPGPWDSNYWTKIFPSAFFHVSDLKDKNGVATITETITVNNSESYIDVKRSIYNGSYTLAVNGDEATVTQWPYSGKNNRIKVLQPQLQEGDIVVVSYSAKEDDENMFAFTFGRRAAESPVGPMSIGMGNFITSSGIGSWAEGWSTVASGDYSHAEGWESRSNGDCSHAEGWETKAKGVCSHVEGKFSEANGEGSHAQNWGTIAQCRSQTTIGEYNKIDTTGTDAIRGNYAFIIGNGRDEYSRSNALTVDWQGNVDIASGAKYKINGIDLSASDVSALPISGGTLTGDLTIGDNTQIHKVIDLDSTTHPSSALYPKLIELQDTNGLSIGYVEGTLLTDGKTGISLTAKKMVSDTAKYNYLRLLVDDSGDPIVQVGNSTAWREGLGLGSLATKSSVAPTTLAKTCSAKYTGSLSGAHTFSVTVSCTADSGYKPIAITGIYPGNTTGAGEVYLRGFNMNGYNAGPTPFDVVTYWRK